MRTKDREKRAMSLGAMVTVAIAGIAEPSMFGICYKEKTPVIGNILGCMIAGIVQGFLTVHCYIFTFSSIPSILMFYSADEPNNLWKAIIVGVVAFVASFIIRRSMAENDEENHVF